MVLNFGPVNFDLAHLKVFFRRIHLYLALAAGLVFFVQCLTGTVLIFEEEITRALYSMAVPAG